ncbi:MAG: SulP family inorganic anion transporter [Thiobacillaceae bacterium]|jgi:SulP family sulfate permease|nr:SulP family inorganic anion transporter [Hydrogenophilales bacterium]MBP8901533.1 SulP family inorganic anion transporter [Thiobacillaceae bacterium]MBP9915443.1 SulP family inorganic anion transporter [Thiobacillaceae bacterium]
MNNPLLLRIFPFLAWFPINSVLLRGDLIAGITGALVLVPKAMAYAQLSGLPVYFGLYVAFVPAILGALWGSSRQLSTGPVAIVSLMTAAAITPLAVPFSEEFIGLALLLALMVGVIQFTLGAVKLGTVVNFVSHPVILGFMNAAAVIIALSQLDMLLGIPKGRSDSFLYDIWEMFGYLPQTHLPTLAMSIFALALMLGLKKIPALSKLSVLIAVVVTILASALLDFEHKTQGKPEHIADATAQELVTAYAGTDKRVLEMSAEVTALAAQARQAHKAKDARAAADLEYTMEVYRLDIATLEAENKERMHAIRKLQFERAKADEKSAATLYVQGQVPPGVETDGRHWHIKKIEKGEVKLVGGGDVVGKIPSGLPSFRLPPLSLDAMLSLLSAAFIIALVAFMESISMAKALAAQTKQRLDPNQELIGQGLANIGGAFFQAYPACGSFTGSAINLQAGAKTGFAMVFNGLFVAVTLLFLTEFLYHLPKATLAVIILLAVTSLITPKALKHTWQASKFDGIVAGVTFAITLIAAPHLDKGILIGAGLAIILYLYRTMKPRVAQLGRFKDGTLRDIKVNPDLPTSPHIIAMRFDGSLYFANISYFEDTVLELIAAKPDAKYLLVVGDAINQLDASGEEVVHHLVERLREGGMEVVFSGLKKQILDVMRSTGLFELIGQNNIFATEDQAIAAIYERLGETARDDLFCAVPARA